MKLAEGARAEPSTSACIRSAPSPLSAGTSQETGRSLFNHKSAAHLAVGSGNADESIKTEWDIA